MIILLFCDLMGEVQQLMTQQQSVHKWWLCLLSEHILLIPRVIKHQRVFMINYSQFQINHLTHHFFQLLHSEPLIDNHPLPFHPFAEQANPSTNDDHPPQEDHPDQSAPPSQLPQEESEGFLPMISHRSDYNEVLKIEEDSQQSKIKRKFQRRLKNQTKNIPKNFGKGIISFIQKNQKKIRGLLQHHKLSYANFKAMLKSQKKIINTIADLRRLWTDETYGKCMRIISNLFFRRYSMDYIFNSRISNYSSHIKYRQSLWNALKNPSEFNHIKQY